MNLFCFSDITRIEIGTSTNWFSEMDNSGAVRVTVWNAYGNGCGTPWLWGPSNFQRGDTFIATDCNGYIMPNKVFNKIDKLY